MYDFINVIEELDGGGQLEARYTYGSRTDEIISQTRQGMVYYYHIDAIGTVRSLTDHTGDIASSYNYDVFGETRQQLGNIVNPYRFTGRRLDEEIGLYYYRARYYDSAIGRFLQTDPVGYTAGLNLYSYCNNNPVNLTDPLGLWYEGSSWKSWGSALSGAAGLGLVVGGIATGNPLAVGIGAGLIGTAIGLGVSSAMDVPDTVDNYVETVNEITEEHDQALDEVFEELDELIPREKSDCPD